MKVKPKVIIIPNDVIMISGSLLGVEGGSAMATMCVCVTLRSKSSLVGLSRHRIHQEAVHVS